MFWGLCFRDQGLAIRVYRVQGLGFMGIRASGSGPQSIQSRSSPEVPM